MAWFTEHWDDVVLWAVTTGLATLAVWVRQKLKATKNRQDAINDGVKAILHDRIYQAHGWYMRQGYCSLEDKKNIEYLFTPYRNLGGNGTGERAYDDIMALPTEPEKKAEKREEEEE